MSKTVTTSSMPSGRTSTDRPLVSVLMPAYSHAPYIEQAIRSVWSQTYRNIELIVVDDCSPDATFEIARTLGQESPVPMKVVQNPANQGISNTLNHALRLSSGELISILASDDWFEPHKTEDQVSILLKDKSVVCVHSNSFLVTPENEQIGEVYGVGLLPALKGDCFWDIAYGRGNLVAITAMFWRDLIDEFDPSLLAEDFDLHLRLSQQGRYAFISAPLTYSRIVPGSLGKRPDKYIDELFVVLRKHRGALGINYDDVIMTRALHAINICAAHDYWVGLENVINLGIDHSRSTSEMATFLSKAIVVCLSMVGREQLAHHVPQFIRQGLSRVYQKWLFQVR